MIPIPTNENEDEGKKMADRIWAKVKPQDPQPANSAPLDAKAVREVLERIRAEKKPTRRGILVCGAMMADMLRAGWSKDHLDALEIVFWQVRDADGRPIWG